MSRFAALLLAGAFLTGCSGVAENGADEPPSPASWTIEEAAVFPEARNLARPEDGVILADGRLIVGDLRHGLAEIAVDGTVTPFGDFAAAGFSSEGGDMAGAPNGVHLSPDGSQILVADVHTGAIYITDVASETTRLAYQHSSLVNTAISDSTGAIWFTQSTQGLGGERLTAAFFATMGDGALYRLERNADGSYPESAEVLVEGLDFANGFAIDEEAGQFYLAESLGNRVWAFALDLDAGTLSEQRVLAELPAPDNIRLVDDGSLWVASPLSNRVFAVDLATGESRIVFDAQTRAGAQLMADLMAKGSDSESPPDLLAPEVLGKMPGLLTGIIVDGEDRPIYISGLGDALVRLER